MVYLSPESLTALKLNFPFIGLGSNVPEKYLGSSFPPDGEIIVNSVYSIPTGSFERSEKEISVAYRDRGTISRLPVPETLKI